MNNYQRVLAKMMNDNKHYKAHKCNGFWDFVSRDPGLYVGRHRHGPGMHPVAWLLENNKTQH